MQLVKYFNQFMKDEVNLNQSRINTLDKKVATLKNFIKNSDTFKDIYIDMFSQGSYRHKTIIKPPKNNKEFDADILLYLDLVDEWEKNPKEYINALYEIFNVDRYRNIREKNTRCVTINYKGDFHIDIVPLIKRNGEYYIINRKDNKFEKTNPIEYTKWLEDKNRKSNYQLRKVIRLFKYLRDIKQNFTIKSILLNTMLANHIYEGDSEDVFKDLPTTFKTLINRLNNFLQTNHYMPHIYNPTMPKEYFMRNWTQEQYSNFRNKIKMYNDKVNEAYNEKDRDKSIKKWREVFGDRFPSVVRSEKLMETDENYTPYEEYIADKVQKISLDYQVKIECIVKQDGFRPMLLEYIPILKKKKSLEFKITKINVPEPYKIYWKVKNEGEEARRANDLRGRIFLGGKTHRESTKYKGSHFVECYIVKNNILVAMDRIDVPIEIKKK